MHPRGALRPGRPRHRDHRPRRQALLRRREHQHAPEADEAFKYYFCLHANETLLAARAHAEARHRGAQRARDGRRPRDRARVRPPRRAGGAVPDRPARGDARASCRARAGRSGCRASSARAARWSSWSKGDDVTVEEALALRPRQQGLDDRDARAVHAARSSTTRTSSRRRTRRRSRSAESSARCRAAPRCRSSKGSPSSASSRRSSSRRTTRRRASSPSAQKRKPSFRAVRLSRCAQPVAREEACRSSRLIDVAARAA